MYKNSTFCPLNCQANSVEDIQEHILLCSKLSEGSSLEISDTMSDEVSTQVEVAKLFRKLMRNKEEKMETEDSIKGLPGTQVP